MGLLMRFEKVEAPIGPRDHQIHRTSLADDLDAMLDSARAEGISAYPGQPFNGYTYEIVSDGAGVKHYNLTVHFKSLEVTLNPRNLNDSPQQMFGQVLDGAELERRGIGRADVSASFAGAVAVPLDPTAQNAQAGLAGAIPSTSTTDIGKL